MNIPDKLFSISQADGWHLNKGTSIEGFKAEFKKTMRDIESFAERNPQSLTSISFNVSKNGQCKFECLYHYSLFLKTVNEEIRYVFEEVESEDGFPNFKVSHVVNKELYLQYLLTR